MNSVTLIGSVRAPVGTASFVLAIEREGSQPDLVPITGADATEGERLVVEGALRMRGRELAVEAAAVHRLPGDHMV